MTTQLKRAALLALIAAQVSYPVLPTAQETLSKVRAVRPTTLQALKDIKRNIDEEIKSTRKSIENLNGKVDDELKRDFQELQKVKSEIEKQISDFPPTTVIKEKKGTVIDSIKEQLPSQDKIKEKALATKDNIKEAAHEIKKDSKKIWSRFVSRVKRGSQKITQLFYSIGSKFRARKTLEAYKVNEYQSEDEKKYYLVMTMPNFTKEQIDISLHEASKGRYVLIIIAENDRIKSTSNGDKALVSKQSITSSVSDSKDRHLHFYDGKLEVSIDLPRNIKPHTYNMIFEEHTLKIEFDQDIATSHKPLLSK